jgi:hypothetical protein
MGIQVFSRLLSFGMAEGKLMNNICNGIDGIYSADRSGPDLDGNDLAELEKHASPEVMQAAKLGALTGLRQADLLRLSWSHMKPNSIEIATGKSKPAQDDADPALRGAAGLPGGLPKRATTVLVNTEGHSWRTGFGSSWESAR